MPRHRRMLSETGMYHVIILRGMKERTCFWTERISEVSRYTVCEKQSRIFRFMPFV